MFLIQVLDANPVHVKAFYRRGMAYMAAGDFQEARDDFNKVNILVLVGHTIASLLS